MIKLSKGNLSQVRPGMFWYEDNTLSSELDSSKQLKSVVLFVEGDVVYGDSFMMRFGHRKSADRYLEEEMLPLLEERGLSAQEPTVKHLQEVFSFMTPINASLRKAKQLSWSEDCFWVKSTTPKIVNLYAWNVREVSAEYTAYVRPVIVYQL